MAAAFGGETRLLAVFGRFPQNEIPRVGFFIFIDIDTRARTHAAEVAVRELSVLRKFRDSKIIGTIIGAVGESLFHQLGDEVGHLGNVVSGVDQLRLFDIQSSGVFKKCMRQ